MEQILYQWQEDYLKRWFSNKGRGIVQAVTDSGKTLLALTAADRLEQMTESELRVKIVVPTGALMQQWNRSLRDFCSAKYARQNEGGDPGKVIGLRGAGSTVMGWRLRRSSGQCVLMIFFISESLSRRRNGKNIRSFLTD